MPKLNSTAALVVGVAVLLGGILGYSFLTDRKKIFLPGTTSDGHFLMEEACSSCHGGFTAITNESCMDCHGQELGRDTHSTLVFDDPRWAADLELIDAMRCITCHGEHQVAMGGVTVEPSFCFPCHDDVVEKRASHAEFSQDSCGSAGCHAYHDNSALNTAFLQNRYGQETLFANAALPSWRGSLEGRTALAAPDHPDSVSAEPALIQLWLASRHAAAGVGCQDCHGADSDFQLEVTEASCQSCHTFEVDTFYAGKHGVRSSLDLPALKPGDARLPMKPPSAEQPVQMSCGACHDPHSVDTRRASVEACLSCHADEHSRNYEASPHAATLAGNTGPTGPQEVTCATCHLPRVEIAAGSEAGGSAGKRWAVHHNNTLTLRPTNSMAAMVCQSCHGFEFSLTSVLDPALVANNFLGPPQQRLDTFRLIEDSLSQNR